MNHKQPLLPLAFLAALILAACDVSPEQETVAEDKLIVVDEIAFPSDQIYALMGAGQLSGGEIIFSDFFSRRLMSYDPSDSTIRTVGTHGDGPGEYRMPARIRVLKDDRVAFSDMQAARINVIDESGAHVLRVNHTSGNQPFDVFKGRYFVRSLGDAYVTEYDQDGDLAGRYVAADNASHLVLSQVSGGGVAVVDSVVYVMNGLQPYIYAEDMRTRENHITELRDWDLFQHYSADVLSVGRIDELPARTPEVPIHHYFGAVSHNAEQAFAIFSRWDDSGYLTIMSLAGEVLEYIPMDGQLIGVQEDLFFVETGKEGAQRLQIVQISPSS